MDSDLARRSHAVLMKAIELGAREREAFVNAACAGDPLLRARVADLMGAIDRSRTFLQLPALEKSRAALIRTMPAAPPATRNYTIVKTIGVGGMATVYEAIQDQPRRRVALKMLRFGLAHTSALARFRFETEVLARLQHPGIAQIFEAGAYDDGHGCSIPYFAMEYIADASPITEYARRRQLSLQARLALVASVCDAVQHGHQHGVIHRDLKPGNVLIDALGNAKVIDFGVARACDQDAASITRDAGLGQLVGTLNYMSPEQCMGGRQIDIRTDVYSLGVVLYELVCTTLPHDLSRVPVPEALRIIRQDMPRPPSTHDIRLRGDIDAIVAMAIDKDPDRRYPTAAALAADIRRYLHGEGVEARPPTLMYRGRLFVRRHRVLVAAGAAVILAITGGGLLSGWYAFQVTLESQRRIAAEARAISERDAARWQAYVGNISGAFAALQTNEFQQFRCRLAATPEEHRGWEWGFLSGMAERSQQTIRAHEDMIFALAASPDGTRLVTGGRDGTLRVWDAASGECTARVEGAPDAAIYSVAFSSDGARIVTGSEDQTVRLWDAKSGVQLCLIGQHDAWVSSVSHAQSGLIASAADDGSARLWDADSGALRSVLQDQPDGIHGVSFSEDGQYLLTWNRSGSVWLRSADGKSVHLRLSFDGQVQQAIISADSKLIAAGGAQGRVVIWNAATGMAEHRLNTYPSISTVRSLAFSSNGDRIAAGQTHRGVVIWALADGRKLSELRGHDEAISGVWFAPAGDRLVTSSWDGSIRTWDVGSDSTHSPAMTLTGHGDEVISAAFSPDGAILASGGRDRTVRLWDPNLGLELGALRGHREAVYSVAFAPDGRLIATGSHDHTVGLWDASTGAPAEPLIDHTGPVWSVAFSPDGRFLASAGDDAVIRIWDIQAGSVRTRLVGHARRVIHIAYSPDGRTLASASRDHSVRLWNVHAGTSLRTLDKHKSDVFAVVFSHDGRFLYSGSRDQTVRVWNIESGECSRVLGGHGQFVTSLSLSPDGKRLAAGSWFGEIVLWDLPSHEIVASFKGHETAIRAVVFGPNAQWLVSTSYDGTAHVFNSATSIERQVARESAKASYESAKELIDRLAGDDGNIPALAEAVESVAGLDLDTRAWARKIILMRSLRAAGRP